ncbi:MAG: aminopeptidase P family protein [SAR324 cluster bacterium]|nr:aminopeptidase P family protein [SAR324 cluster bacterium]
MLEQARQRTAVFQEKLRDAGIRQALLTDESSIAYLAGFWGYLGVEFGRPTCLIVRPDEEPIVITPLMESEMVSRMTWIEDVRTWEDAGNNYWEAVLANSIGTGATSLWVELQQIPAIVRNFLDNQYPGIKLENVAPKLSEMRMIKSVQEIDVMKQAGSIAAVMMGAAEAALAEGAPEYEIALAVINAGTRKAAGFLSEKGWEAFVSPMIHNLQIMQSGKDTSMVHRRASVKALEQGDPVYFCFCNMAQFKQYKLGFDRMFFVGDASDAARHVQMTAVAAQQAALSAIRPGVSAEEVAEAADEIYHSHGFATGYRTGRSIGMAYLESPELKKGDKTRLKPGMTFAVDGGISVDGKLGGRIGDSIVVTETGFEYLTDYSRELLVV